MHEQVLAAAVRRDEAEALGIVEPFHGSGCHSRSFKIDVAKTCGLGRPSCLNAKPADRPPEVQLDSNTCSDFQPEAAEKSKIFW
jgi:hypothetical protein